MNVSVAPYPRFKAFYPGTGTPLSGGLPLYGPGGHQCPIRRSARRTLRPPIPIRQGACRTRTRSPSTATARRTAGFRATPSSSSTIHRATSSGRRTTFRARRRSSPRPFSGCPRRPRRPTSSATQQFIVIGNQTTTYPPGTAIMALITGTQHHWVSCKALLHTARTTRRPSPSPGTRRAQRKPVRDLHGHRRGGRAGLDAGHAGAAYTANKTANATDLFQTREANSANATIVHSPAPNSIPSGRGTTFSTLGAGNTRPQSARSTGALNFTLAQRRTGEKNHESDVAVTGIAK